LFLPVTPLAADVFLFKDGGKVEGELLNPNELSRKSYRIKTADGLEIRIDPKLIDRVRKKERDALLEYNASAPFDADTIENHLKWAKWCHEHQLSDLARVHWQQILELDPEHVEARRILDYIKAEDGGWITRQEKLERRGLVKDQGRWKTRQQIEVEQMLGSQQKAKNQWEKKINAIRKALPNDEKARKELAAITDPAAVEPLVKAIRAETKEAESQILMLRALSRIGTIPALRFIVDWAVRTLKAENVRAACYEELVKHPEAKNTIVRDLILDLRADNPQVVNIAAAALGEVEGETAIPALIEALMTTHKVVRQVEVQGHGVGTGGSGLDWGSSKIVEENTSRNQDVLTTLRKLTGNDFQFDQEAWRNWYRQSRRAQSFDLRRD
jgi:hypothetical protein